MTLSLPAGHKARGKTSVSAHLRECRAGTHDLRRADPADPPQPTCLRGVVVDMSTKTLQKHLRRQTTQSKNSQDGKCLFVGRASPLVTKCRAGTHDLRRADSEIRHNRPAFEESSWICQRKRSKRPGRQTTQSKNSQDGKCLFVGRASPLVTKCRAGTHDLRRGDGLPDGRHVCDLPHDGANSRGPRVGYRQYRRKAIRRRRSPDRRNPRYSRH